MKYKLLGQGEYQGLVVENDDGSVKSIPFDPANIDYQTFRQQINADEAQLENADGVLMTAEDAKAFVATLP